LDSVKNDDGSEFASKNDRAEYILNFYENLYKESATSGTIENFLGPEICNSELVRNSKLTDLEKTSLDSDLHINELDEALRKSNFRSAPGRDGFSNVYIRHFWKIFRLPLYSVAKAGLNNGDLPSSFKLTDIKLIPKKDDPG
jgi:hypothetical protein